MKSLSLLAGLSLTVALAACGGSAASVGDPAGGANGASSPGPNGAPTGSGAASDPGGPTVTIAMRGSTAPFAHADGFSGETPSVEIVAVQKLLLLRSPDDPSPLTVFDHGASPVEADLVGGKTTTVASVPRRSLASGAFVLAKVGIAYVRYSVAGRLHATGAAIDGRYDDVQALSDGAVIDGTARKKGFFRWSFAVGGTTYGTLEGDNAPTPVLPSGGGITLDASGPESFYVFPVTLAIDPDAPTDATVTFEANISENFRWQDQELPGYQAGVFDTTPSTFEPVMAFGANAFTLSVQ